MARHAEFEALSKRRWRVSIALTAIMTAIYFGFMMLAVLGKSWMAEEVAPGLSHGILIGALVIISAWILIVVYVVWANNSYDPQVRALRASAQDAKQ
ncbi:hypothetical protein BH09SUM1_BH09SUM1_05350 [soil metagenome]